MSHRKLRILSARGIQRLRRFCEQNIWNIPILEQLFTQNKMTQVPKTFSQQQRVPHDIILAGWLRSIAIPLVFCSAWYWRPQTFFIVVHAKRRFKNCIYIIWNRSQKGKNRSAKWALGQLFQRAQERVMILTIFLKIPPSGHIGEINKKN